MTSKTFIDKETIIDADWLNDVDRFAYGPATKTIAKTLTPVDGAKIYPQGSDGGVFVGGTGKAVGYYNDNGGDYYGTRFKPTGGDGSAGWERDYSGSINTRWYGDLVDGSTDSTVSIQAAIDHANSLYLGGSTGGGGQDVSLSPGKHLYTGLTLKDGVNLIGSGRNVSLLMLTGDNNTGLTADATVSADTLSWGHIRDIGMFSNDSTPTGQIQIDLVGLTRFYFENLFIEWFSGCNGFVCEGATLAGSGGPSQWYNTFINCNLVNAASRPDGGTACIFGDDDSTKEQITAITWIGGRISGSGNTGTTGMALRGTGNTFIGLTFEGCADALVAGSASTRGANSNQFFGCYWESNTSNWDILANATGTQIIGAFVTGGTDSDAGIGTVIDNYGIHQGFSGSSGSQKWEVIINNGGVRRPIFKGSTLPSIGLENAAGTEAVWANGSSTSSSDQYHRFLDDGLTTALFQFGTTNATFNALNIRMRGNASFGMFSGAGSPEGVITADPGSQYMNTSGGASVSLYVKETGVGTNTGWVAK